MQKFRTWLIITNILKPEYSFRECKAKELNCTKPKHTASFQANYEKQPIKEIKAYKSSQHWGPLWLRRLLDSVLDSCKKLKGFKIVPNNTHRRNCGIGSILPSSSEWIPKLNEDRNSSPSQAFTIRDQRTPARSTLSSNTNAHFYPSIWMPWL